MNVKAILLLTLILFIWPATKLYSQELEFKRNSIRTGIGYNDGKREIGVGLIYSIGLQKRYGSENRLALNPNLVIGDFLLLTSKGKGDSVTPDSVNMDRRTFYKVVAVESAYYISAIFVLQKVWYKDKKVVPFHFYNDTQGYLQVDKFGHAFGAYLESYLAYQYLRNSGVSKTKALIYGGSLGLILQTPIEIMDGIHEGYGFSWGDMAANTLGSGLVVGQELLFNEQIVKYKFSYRESGYSKNANGFLGVSKLDRLLKDYNGHTYWFSMPVNKLIPKQKIPGWLSIAVGYGANGMYGENENISNFEGVVIPSTMRYRQYLLSLDIDLTKIKTNSKPLKAIFQGLSFIKLPFPTLELNSKGGVKGYWLY